MLAKRAFRTIIRGSFLGALEATNRSLIFFSSGASGISWRFKALLRGFFEGFPNVFVPTGTARSKGLDHYSGVKVGSFEVPLQRIAVCEASRRWDRSPYLKLSFQDADRTMLHKVLMTEAGLDMQKIKAIESAVMRAKAEQEAQQPRA
jgi:hypothetical protein